LTLRQAQGPTVHVIFITLRPFDRLRAAQLREKYVSGIHPLSPFDKLRDHLA